MVAPVKWPRKSLFLNVLVSMTFIIGVFFINGCAAGFSIEKKTLNKADLTLTTTTVPQGSLGTSYGTTFHVAGGAFPYMWSVTAGKLPAGLSLSASDGTLTGTPRSVGTFQFTLQVNSPTSVEAASKSFSAVIKASSTVVPMQILRDSLSAAVVNGPYSQTLTANGGQVPYVWAIFAGSLPGGLSLEPGSGQITGTPRQPGTFPVLVTVQDASPTVQTVAKDFEIVVVPSPKPVPMDIVTSSLTTGVVNTHYSQALAATGGLAPYSWSISSAELPSGLSLTPGRGQIEGTPTRAGTFPVQVTVQDSSPNNQQVTKALNIAIAPFAAPIQIVTGSLAAAEANTHYSQALAATGGTAPYSWSISSEMPSGLSLTPGRGQIEGTPTRAGTFPVQVTVQDSSSSRQKATKTLNIAIAPSVTPVEIVTGSLSSGAVKANYLQNLSATGGKAPYRWSIVSGLLPSGLSLVGELGHINGTPTQPGTFSVGVLVRDSSVPPQTASQTYSINVGPLSPKGEGIPIASCQILATTGATYTLQNDVSSPASCLNVQATDVTIQLNGHTITYSNSVTPPDYAVFGVYGAAVWDPNFTSDGIAVGNTTGGHWDNLSIAGPGTITQGNCLAPSNIRIGSNAVHLGQGGGDGLNVFQVTFNICADSTQAIFADANGAGVSIHDNIVNDRVVTAHKRSYFQGAAFLCDGCFNDHGAPSNFYNNTITGGPQSCIMWNNPDTNLYNNTCSHGNPTAVLSAPTASNLCQANPYSDRLGTLPLAAGTQCTNDFGLYARGIGGSIFGNTITPLEGRGIFVGHGSGMLIHDNIVSGARELPNNAEYNGCEIGGAYGLQFDDNGNNESVYHNTISALSNLCSASALRVTDSETYGNISRDNIYVSARAAGSPSNCLGFISNQTNCAYGISLNGTSGINPLKFTSQNDSFTADSAMMFFDWTGPHNQALFISPTFKKGANADPDFFHFAVFRNGAGTVDVHVRDATFGPGVDPTDVFLPAQGPNNKAASLYVEWTLKLTVQNHAGNPIRGARVTYSDALGKSECEATTDFSGQALCTLIEYRLNNDSGANQVETHNPFSYKLSAPGCMVLTGSESIIGTVSEAKTLSGC